MEKSDIDFTGMNVLVVDDTPANIDVQALAEIKGHEETLLYNHEKLKSTKEVAVILNDYSFKSSMVQDQEMNMTACLLSLMEVMNN